MVPISRVYCGGVGVYKVLPCPSKMKPHHVLKVLRSRGATPVGRSLNLVVLGDSLAEICELRCWGGGGRTAKHAAKQV